MSQELQIQKELILQALQEYKKDPSQAKPFYSSMQEISLWLSEQATK